MQSLVVVIFAATALAQFSVAYDVNEYDQPMNRNAEADIYCLQPDDGFSKRATQDHKLAAIPRSGLMISGRGWMPGFFDSQPQLYKRSSPVNDRIAFRPLPIV
ncbi:unnamed protein product [Caenorhabditis bovis]|uniref:Uncharacterized protein n=1 Tax=Caenorhabditis bovis TaxID=2654633 RepID=A0A8S1EA06_9PELO|nr:unnamed protein product [Caenorhabditis bovis]